MIFTTFILAAMVLFVGFDTSALSPASLPQPSKRALNRREISHSGEEIL
jgi:hypothetical protein